MIDLSINKVGLEHNIQKAMRTTLSSPPLLRCRTPI